MAEPTVVVGGGVPVIRVGLVVCFPLDCQVLVFE